MMLRLLLRACDVVWARRLEEREEGRRVGVGGRGMRVLVGTLLRAVARPLLCEWYATRRSGVGCMNWLLVLLIERL